jgi:hypothetical protein
MEANEMRRALDLIIILLFCAWPANAQLITPPNRVGHWLKTHWVLLVADGLVIAAQGADVGSSIHCQHVAPKACQEGGGLFGGKHPSESATIGNGAIFAGSIVAFNHTWWWLTGKYDAKDLRPLMLFWNAPFVIFEGINTANNVHDTESLQKARQRVMR